jgi:hypothetical protein
MPFTLPTLPEDMPLSMPVDSESRVRLCVPADTVRVSDKVRVQLHVVVHTHRITEGGTQQRAKDGCIRIWGEGNSNILSHPAFLAQASPGAIVAER